MVGQTALWIVVGPDALGAVARTDLAFTLGGVFGVLLIFLRLKQAGAHDGERLGPVFDLRAFVGAVDGDTSRLVHHHDSGVGRVDMLPPCPAGTHSRDFKVVRVDLDIDFFGFGEYGDGRSGGVDAPLGFGRGHALHAVHATLKFEILVGVLSRHLKNNLLKPTHVGRAGAHDFDPPTTCFRVAAIHAEQIAGEDVGLIAAGAPTDFHDGVPAVGGIGRDHEAEHIVG